MICTKCVLSTVGAVSQTHISAASYGIWGSQYGYMVSVWRSGAINPVSRYRSHATCCSPQTTNLSRRHHSLNYRWWRSLSKTSLKDCSGWVMTLIRWLSDNPLSLMCPSLQVVFHRCQAPGLVQPPESQCVSPM